MSSINDVIHEIHAVSNFQSLILFPNTRRCVVHWSRCSNYFVYCRTFVKRFSNGKHKIGFMAWIVSIPPHCKNGFIKFSIIKLKSKLFFLYHYQQTTLDVNHINYTNTEPISIYITWVYYISERTFRCSSWHCRNRNIRRIHLCDCHVYFTKLLDISYDIILCSYYLYGLNYVIQITTQYPNTQNSWP